MGDGGIKSGQIRDETIISEDIKNDSVESQDIKNEGVYREDLNVSTPGKAVARKVTVGDGLEATYSGVDEGTGDIILKGKPRIIDRSGRIYCYSNNRWIAINDDLYGATYYQHAENANAGADPLLEWEHNGIIVTQGEKLKRFLMMGRTNNTQITDLNISIQYLYPTPTNDYAGDIDTDTELQNIEIFRGTFNGMVQNLTGLTQAGPSNDKHIGSADINYTFGQPIGELRLYVQPVGNLTGTRYFYSSRKWEIY